MYARDDLTTRYHISLEWWQRRGRNLRLYLADMLGDVDDSEVPADELLDHIDPDTAEVRRLDPLWVRVLLERTRRPDYITASTPMAHAVLRALIETANEPMTVVEMQRRIGRGTPETLLRLMRTARNEYGVVPVTE
jgi:hypothetical protein